MDILKKQMEGMEANILKHQETLSKQLSDVVKDLVAWRERIEGEISSLKEGQTKMEARIIGVEEKLSHGSIKDTLLKEGRTKFNTILVRKDLTRQEQAEWKEKSKARAVKGTGATSSERMATRLSKRKNDYELDSQQPKLHRVDVTSMQMN
ncbi:Transcription elongation factor GreA [Folsomia candida]|uniref:Transcription elongation factor GreA n=1 Tax=Folsomia candida TaxID=158441 RepID=A0A226D9K9_FOLCA|nr:Transcription elongation factor GreA [Folsomia candida]